MKRWKLTGRRLYGKALSRFSRRRYLKRLVASLNEHSYPDYEEEVEELAILESDYWLKRARGVYLSVIDVPLKEGEDGHWLNAIYVERSFVRPSALNVLIRMVETAEYERKKRSREGTELWIKWFTAVVSLIAASASVWNLILTKSR